MPIIIISDVHGNLPALEKVMAYADGIHADGIYCLGDIVGYGPFPAECLDIIRDRCSHIVAGNHDRGVTGDVPLKLFSAEGQKVLRWTRKRIDRGQMEFLRDLPFIAGDGMLTLAHASPASPETWPYVTSAADALEAFGAFTTKICCIGHTHVPATISEKAELKPYNGEERFLINVGSVGQPRDGDPRSAFGLFDQEKGTFEIIRIEYDIGRTIEGMMSEGLPRSLADRLRWGL